MYEAFYGFKEKPFSMLPDPSFLFLSKKHRAALTLLEYGLMNQVGFCILSGEPGTGKTTILRALLNRVDDNVKVGLISNTHQSFGGLLDWILSVFDLHKANLTHVEMHQLFVDFLIDEFANNRRVLLIVDEAQNMDADALEELRMLSNVNTEKDQLLQVVLAGQPKLKENLRKPELMQFAQRIAVDYHLHSLSLTETCGYIQHRLVVAGAERDVFTPEACERIHCYSGGSPRLINLLCETALVYGFADETELISADLVEEMVQERMEDSVVPLVNLDGDKGASSKNNEQLVKDFPWIRPEGGTKGLKPEVKARLDDVRKAKNESESKVGASKAPVAALSGQQSVEPELPLADNLIAQDEVLGAKVVADITNKQTTGAVPAVGSAQVDIASVDLKKEKMPVDEHINTDKKQTKAESVATDSMRASDALAKETIAKNQINEAMPKKSNILKYGVYAGVIALGLTIVALFFSDNMRDSGAFEGIKKQVGQVLNKNGLDENKLDGQGVSSANINTTDAVEQKIEEKENTTEQEKLETESQKKEEQVKLAKEKEAKAEQDRLDKEKSDKEKLAQEKAEQEKLAKKQVAKELAVKEKKREAREREASENRKIAQQIQQREAELEAKAETRRLQLEVAKLEKLKRERDEAEKKIQRKRETERLEKEWLEKQREKLREAEANNKSASDETFVKAPKKKLPSNCEGPTARFKAACR